MRPPLRQPSRLSHAIALRAAERGLLDLAEYPAAELLIGRTYAGRHMRSDGAWSWELEHISGRGLDIGSKWPASQVVRWPEWFIFTNSFGQSAILPLSAVALDAAFRDAA